MIELSLMFVWGGCLFGYLTSKHQTIISTPLNKYLGWLGFIVSLIVAQLLVLQVYITVVAMLFVLVAVMTSWIMIVLIQGHQYLKRVPHYVFGFLLVSLFARIGSSYVV